MSDASPYQEVGTFMGVPASRDPRGSRVAVLPNGNIVVTDPLGPSGGTAYLYSAS